MKQLLKILNLQLQISLLSVIFLASCGNQLSIVEPSHLAGRWYPKQAAELNSTLQKMAIQADQKFAMQADGKQIRALIVPHAGYEYSGIIASAAYRLIQNQPITRVIILAPSHFVQLNGIALPSFTHYSLPTGNIAIDTKAINTLKKNPLFIINNAAFNPEHSAEIQMPFIKYYLPQAQIIPLIVGDLSQEAVNEAAQAISNLITPHTLVIVSSDLTHYGSAFSYTPFADNILLNVRQLDSKILDAIQQNNAALYENLLQETRATICGRVPIKILLKLIENGVLGNVITRLIAYGSSADVTNDTTRLVTYGSLIVTQETNNDSLNGQEKTSLLKYARDVLTNSFKKDIDTELLSPTLTSQLKQKKGAFVTLYSIKDGKRTLRGCIGRIIESTPLYQTIADMTLASAFNDQRFQPVKEDELNQLLIEISVLTPPHAINSYKDIILNKHGIILTVGKAHALFLPRVPQEYGFSFEQTLSELSKKAGLSSDVWKSADAKYQVFESLDFEEEKK